MTVTKGKSKMMNVLINIVVALTLLTLVACGGGGGAGSGQILLPPVQQPTAKTVATLKINLSGTLPANTAISGAVFTLTLPANVTPLLSNGAVANSVVALSGTFAGGTQTPPIYTAATPGTSGTLQLALVNAVPAGVALVGEVATITLQLANGATPAAADFSVSSVSVVDAALFNIISGMGANVANVTLQ